MFFTNIYRYMDCIYFETENESLNFIFVFYDYKASQEVIKFEEATIWFSGKEMLRGHLLSEYIGNNEKTKIVAKLAKRGSGAPAREPIMSEEQQRTMMAYYYKKQEEFKKLEADDEDSYLDSPWAESNQLKRNFHGLSNIKWGPR